MAPNVVKAKRMTKQEAVRRALEAKGMDAKPVDLKPYIKQEFGFDMTPEHITTCKSKVVHAPKKGKRGRRKKPGPKPAVQPAVVVLQTVKSSSGAISVEDLQALKGLIGRVGGDHLRTLIELFSG
jgi:hypothetical protein